MCFRTGKGDAGDTMCAVTDLSFGASAAGPNEDWQAPLMPSAANKWIIENPAAKAPSPTPSPPRWDTRPSEHSNDTAADWFRWPCFVCRIELTGRWIYSPDFWGRGQRGVSHTIYIFIFLFGDALTAVSPLCLFFSLHFSFCILPRTSVAVWLFVILSFWQTRKKKRLDMSRGMKFRLEKRWLFPDVTGKNLTQLRLCIGYHEAKGEVTFSRSVVI